MEQLDDLLAGVDVRLSDEILDQIDEIVPPGTDPARPTRPPTCPRPAATEPPPPPGRRARRRGLNELPSPGASRRSALPPGAKIRLAVMWAHGPFDMIRLLTVT